MPGQAQEIGERTYRYRVVCVEVEATVFRAQAVVTCGGVPPGRVELARFTSTARTPHDAMDDVRSWALRFIGSLYHSEGKLIDRDQLAKLNATLEQRGALHTAQARRLTAGTGPV